MLSTAVMIGALRFMFYFVVMMDMSPKLYCDRQAQVWRTIASFKACFSTDVFSYFSMKTYVIGTP